MSELKKYGKEETKRPLIIDKTNQGYDRETLLKKLAENKKTKVTIRETVQIEEKKIESPQIKKTKKAKKINIKTPLIIEEEDEEKGEEKGEEEEEFVMKPKAKEEIIL